MKRRFLPHLVCLGLCLIGIWLSSTLVDMHARGSAGTGLLAGACGAEGSGCDAVIHSRWGVFPPAPAEDTKGTGLPVALLGLWYFVALAAWFATIGPVEGSRAWLHRGVLGLCALGSVASLWFIVVMAAFVHAWCPLCLSSHAVNFGLLAAAFWARPRAAAEPATGRATGPVHPTNRLLGVTAALILGICVAFSQRATILGFEAREREFAEVVEELDAFKQDADTLRAMYESQAEVELDVRDDDPTVLNEKTPYMRITYFSDIECPQCAKFDQQLFEEIKPLFNGHLRIVFKHLPLSDKHPNAMRAALAIQAAHLQGKFWEAHTYLIERRTALASLDYSEMAGALGLNVGRFVTDMSSPAVAEAVNEDLRLAARLRLTGAPSVFLNNRPVSRVLRGYLGFWKERAEALRKVVTEKAGKEW